MLLNGSDRFAIFNRERGNPLCGTLKSIALKGSIRMRYDRLSAAYALPIMRT
jgi:hypothetical protein